MKRPAAAKGPAPPKDPQELVTPMKRPGMSFSPKSPKDSSIFGSPIHSPFRKRPAVGSVAPKKSEEPEKAEEPEEECKEDDPLVDIEKKEEVEHVEPMKKPAAKRPKPTLPEVDGKKKLMTREKKKNKGAWFFPRLPLLVVGNWFNTKRRREESIISGSAQVEKAFFRIHKLWPTACQRSDYKIKHVWKIKHNFEHGIPKRQDNRWRLEEKGVSQWFMINENTMKMKLLYFMIFS